MEPHQFMNVMQMIGFAMGRIESFQKGYTEGDGIYEEFEAVSDALIDVSNYIKHCACCPCEEREELDDGI